jgi:redox-regulated HSP33 family molecular chaperone
MLKKLGRAELMTMVSEGNPAEIRCHYCNKFFNVEVQRMQQLADELGGSDDDSSSSTLN